MTQDGGAIIGSYAINSHAVDYTDLPNPNIVERAIRPQAITRKNSLFAGSDGGGKTWATIATLCRPQK